MSTPNQSTPTPPNYGQLLQQGYQLQKKYAPQLAQLETTLRGQYDPQRVAQAQALQAQYGPTQYNQQLQALQQLDPTGQAARAQLGAGVMAQYAQGAQQDPASLMQEQQYVRAGEAARGNILGNAPASAEALYTGLRGQQLQQQRLVNLGSFLSSPTPEQQITSIQGVSANESPYYVNPQAGNQAAQFGLANYGNQYAAASTPNPWMNAFGGALGGAVAGTSLGFPWGTLGGGLAGGVGGYFSDDRMKTDVKQVAKVPIYQYKYKARYGVPGTFRGPMASEVKKHAPGAVTRVLGHDFVTSPNSLGLTRVKVRAT